MGAPKQKWTSEEEAALKAGITKHGVGKWSAILKDEEFNTVLRLRSNVDLKDKWRNLKCLGSGSGSRQKHRAVKINPRAVSVKIIPPAAKHEEVVDKEVPEAIDANPYAFREIQQDAPITKKQIIRMDAVVMEAIRKLNEQDRGSSRSAIAQYIADHYSAPLDLGMALVANLKDLTESGLLVKVKHQYRIAPMPFTFANDKEPTLLPSVGLNEDPCEDETDGLVLLTKAQIDAELEKMRYMTADEAIKAAAQAVAEAEAAIAMAEAATREAEEAEAEAAAARCFAEATQKPNLCPTIRV